MCAQGVRPDAGTHILGYIPERIAFTRRIGTQFVRARAEFIRENNGSCPRFAIIVLARDLENIAYLDFDPPMKMTRDGPRVVGRGHIVLVRPDRTAMNRQLDRAWRKKIRALADGGRARREPTA